MNLSEKKFFFIQGLKTPELIEEILNGSDPDIPLCVETRSLEKLESIKTVYHISEFGPLHGDPSPREKGRKWVAELSDTTLKCTGKKIYESFNYKGVNAWWFLEIMFQEPAYLYWRRAQALNKASNKLGDYIKPSLEYPTTFDLPKTPAASACSLKELNKQKINSLKSKVIRRIAQQTSILRRFKKSDLLIILEHENLRRHFDLNNGEITTSLPYAEGVIEILSKELGKKCHVTTRRPLPHTFEKWGFINSALPPLVLNPLSIENEKALNEVFRLSSAIVKDYFNLSTLQEVLAFRLAEYDLYLKILKKTRPKVLFIYNWEGVFRPLIAAAQSYGCRIVGVQQALGPYLHGLDHHEFSYYYNSYNPSGFAIPDRIALWGSAHEKEFLSYGYPADSLEITGYARLDKHFQIQREGAAAAQRRRTEVCSLLGLNAQDKYLVFTGQAKVLDTIILRTDHYYQTIESLCVLAEKFRFKIIIKPWASDDLQLVEEIAKRYIGLIFIAHQDIIISNADLLSISDWVVGTFSSILGEAIVTGNACIMLNYPESRYYFDLPHLELYSSIIPFVNDPELLDEVLTPLLADDMAKATLIKTQQNNISHIFGECDGKASERIAKLVLDELSLQC